MSDAARNERSILKRIAGHLPSFRGYSDQSERESSDRQTRTFVGDRLVRTKQSIDRYAKTLVNSAKIDEVSACQQLRDVVDIMGEKLKSQLSIDDGFFTSSKVDEDRIEDVYDCDANLMDEAEDLVLAAEALAESNTPNDKLFQTVSERISSVKRRVTERTELLSELGK